MATQYPLLRLGDGIDAPEFEDEVKMLQGLLKQAGVLPSDAVEDGKFDAKVEQAVKQFQQDRDLLVDGIVGSDTWSALENPAQQGSKQPVLRQGDGIDYPDLKADVKRLQALLKQAGVLPEDAAIDGLFGTKTETAVKQFQAHRDLVADGVVGGQTWSELLGEPVEAYRPRRNVIVSFDLDRIVESIPYPNVRKAARESLPLILTQCQLNGVTDLGQIAYVLATAEHESHLGQWMVELGSGWQYEGRTDLGNTQEGDGPRFKGRGFVQITGRRNYRDWSERLGIDLVASPDRAAEMGIAARILVVGMRDGTFTGYKLVEFVEGDRQDFYGARRIINGFDRAARIATIAREYLRVL
jgi:peptidoglycan hydrolase-like protein with peptidoglycan-binding domain